jgi:hypothetical protein
MSTPEHEIAALQAALAHAEDELRRSREALDAARQLAAATERRRLAEQRAFQQLRIIRWSRLPRRIYQRLRSLVRSSG